MSPGLVGPQKFVFCVFHPVAKGDGTAFGPDVSASVLQGYLPTYF